MYAVNYEPSTGRITQTLMANNEEAIEAQGLPYFITDGTRDGNHYYVNNDQVVPRPTMDTLITQSDDTIEADGATFCYIRGIPSGATVSFNGQSGIPPGGEASVSTTTPGDIHYTIKLWPYIDYKGVIHAV